MWFLNICGASRKQRTTTPEPSQEEGVPMEITSLPNDSSITYLESVNALQGAVSPTSFQVKAKMSGQGQARLVVYRDALRTEPVAYSDLQSTLPTNEIHFEVSGLNASNKLYWSINSNNQQSLIKGSLRTLPLSNSTHKVIISSCGRGNNYGDTPIAADNKTSNSPVFEHIQNVHGDALYFLHLGDLHYGDVGGSNVLNFDAIYDELLTKEKQQNLYLNMPLSYIWDDHDFGFKAAVTESYHKRVPVHQLYNQEDGLGIYHTFTIGRVRYIMLDMRTYKNPNVTILGDIQKQWLKDTLEASDSLVNIVNVGFPWNTVSGSDNWVEALFERQEIIDFMRSINIDNNVVLVAGDLHGLSFDDGFYGEGIPLLHCGSLDSISYGAEDTAFQKGVLSTSGIFMGSDKFVTMEWADDGSKISLDSKGIDAFGGNETVLTNFSREYAGDKVAITTPNNTAVDNNFTISFQDAAANIIADRYIITVDNIPTATVTQPGLVNLTVHTNGLHQVRVLSVKNDVILGRSAKINVNCTGTGIVFDSDYQAVLNYATANSITLPSLAQQVEDNLDMLKLKAIGDWQITDSFFKYKGSASSAFKLVDWKRLVQAIPYGNITWNTTGAEGDGSTAWIDTLYNPTTNGVNYTLNNASFYYVGTKAIPTDAGIVMGALNGGYAAIAPNVDTGLKNFQIHGGYTSTPGDNAEPGFNMLSRRSATNITRGIARKPLDVAINSTSLPNISFGILALNRNTGVQSFSQEEVAYASMGADRTSKFNLLRKILE